MSHFPQRTERNCLNCGTQLQGRYCHNCGQENVSPKESVWHLVSHFFNDITHFDGKFFTSMKDLVLKPGFLSKEYMAGRRVAYLNPIRMYLFTSFIFFLIFFSFYKVDEHSVREGANNTTNVAMDSSQLHVDSAVSRPGEKPFISMTPAKYSSVKEYDSLIAAGKVKDNWFIRMLTRKNIEIDQKYHNNADAAVNRFNEKFLHTIPQLLFLLLPLFALILKLLFIRHKEFYYTDHAIFTIHFYIFVFIGLLFIFGLRLLSATTGTAWLEYVNTVLILLLLFYLYKAMRNVYRQKRFKTIIKFALLLFSFTLFGILFFTVFLLSFFLKFNF